MRTVNGDMFDLDNGLETDVNTYIGALRRAWAIYGALVAEGCLPAYNFDGSEQVQLAKWTIMHNSIGAITTTLVSLGEDTLSSDFAVWERENKPTLWTTDRIGGREVEDEDLPDKPMPKENDDLYNFLNDAIAVMGLPYDIIKHNDRSAEYLKTFDKEEINALHVLLLKKLIDRGYKIIPPDEPAPAKKGKKKGKKSA